MNTNSGGRANKLWPRISLGIIVVGVLLMMVMMYTESEPGLLPLAMITIGIALYIFTSRRNRY